MRNLIVILLLIRVVQQLGKKHLQVAIGPELCRAHHHLRNEEIRPHHAKIERTSWLPIKQHLYLSDAVLAFNCMTGCALRYLSDQFITRNKVTKRVTRNCQLLNIPHRMLFFFSFLII